jgi:hypothetical protein
MSSFASPRTTRFTTKTRRKSTFPGDATGNLSPLREVCLANLESENGFFRYNSWNRRLRPFGELHMLLWNTQRELGGKGFPLWFVPDERQADN